jgi:hypothetical protein
MHELDPETACYRSLRTYEDHFSQMMLEVRKLGSAWLLASFGALAVLVKGGLATSSLLTTCQAIAFVCLLAGVGVLVLWILDLTVYRGLLESAFLVGLRIEQRHPDIPPIRSMMMLIARASGMGRYQVWFYRGPLIAFAVISLAASLCELPSSKSLGNAFLIPILPTLSIGLVLVECLGFAQSERGKLERMREIGIITGADEGELQRNVHATVAGWGQRFVSGDVARDRAFGS